MLYLFHYTSERLGAQHYSTCECIFLAASELCTVVLLNPALTGFLFKAAAPLQAKT